jgi:AraC-like DNA-binding protein
MESNNGASCAPKSWEPAEFPGLQILHGGFRNHEFPRHYHDGLMISLIDDGAQRVLYRGRTHLAGAGRVVAIAPGEVHGTRPACDIGWRYRVFTVPHTLISRLSGTHDHGQAFDVVINDPVLAARLSTAHAAFRLPSTTLEREELLLSALDRFLVCHVQPAPRTGRDFRDEHAVRRAMEYLSEHRARNVALTELADAIGLDGFHLTRTFTRAVGMPPHAYHLQQRLRTAQGRLAAGDNVTDVAQALGFADQAHLTRLFKRLMGVTPGQYRAAHGHSAFRR